MNCRDGDKTWKDLKAQVARLSQMIGFPREPEAIRELVLALQAASSIEQATEVISAFIDGAESDSRCPMPKAIREACRALQLAPQPDPLCQVCGGSGYRVVTRAGLSGAERCRCWAPRPAPKVDYVPLPGHPGYVEKPMPKVTAEDIEEAQKLAEKIYGTS